jgi:hypothetical protein
MGTAIDDLAVTATAHGESQATDLEVLISQSTRNPLYIALLFPALFYSTLLYSILLYFPSLCCALISCFNDPRLICLFLTS